MRSLVFVLGLVFAFAAAAAALADEPPPQASVQIVVDSSEAPDLDGWGQKAKALGEEWYPQITELLKSDGFTPPRDVKITFKKAMRGVAGTSNDHIVVSADYVRRHPQDFGMIIHELTHVVQSYPPSRAGWLVEGIADYIRFWHFEPNAPRPRIDPEKASYRDAYKTTAAFLAWIEEQYDPDIVHRANESLRKGRFTEGLFKESTGKDLNELWAEFAQSLRAKGA
jgi:Peptidase of plants and bacteria